MCRIHHMTLLFLLHCSALFLIIFPFNLQVLCTDQFVLENSEPSSIVKIGEGTYGEAFRAGETVCKVVPIDGDSLVNGEVQKV